MTVLDTYTSVCAAQLVIDGTGKKLGQTWQNLANQYTLTYASMKLRRYLTPLGNYRYVIYLRGADGKPTGSALDWTAWYAVSGISAVKPTLYSKALTQAYIVDASLWYVEVLETDGWSDSNNYIASCCDLIGGHAGTAMKYIPAYGWDVYANVDMDFQVEGNQVVVGQPYVSRVQQIAGMKTW
jgi:hypothetical protein